MQARKEGARLAQKTRLSMVTPEKPSSKSLPKKRLRQSRGDRMLTRATARASQKQPAAKKPRNQD